MKLLEVLRHKDIYNEDIYFIQLLSNVIEQVSVSSESLVLPELPDVLFDIEWAVNDELKHFCPGEILIPSTYFSFVDFLRKYHGLTSYETYLEEHLFAAQTD